MARRGRPTSDASATALKYCKDNPDMPNRTLAKLLRKEFPAVYPSIENARSHVRTNRGKMGDANRKCRTDKTEFKDDSFPVNVLAPSRGMFKPKVLIMDIETLPNLAYVWSCFKTFVQPNQMLQNITIASWAAKWLDKKKILWDSAEHDEDDKRICQTLWELFDEADIVIGHNGKAFDEKTMNTRWVFYGMVPPSPYKSVDTLQIAKKRFRFEQNKLDYIARYLGIGEKMHHSGFEMWKGCMNGDAKAWKMMVKYNKKDVKITEEVYLKLRAWDNRHPNVALMYDDKELRCPVCGGDDMEHLVADSLTSVSVFDSYRCVNCGKLMRGGKRKDVKEVRRHSL